MFYLCTRVFLNKHLMCLAKFITIFVLCVFIRTVFASVICLLDSQDTIWQETSKCWFSTVSQPELHPVRGSHGTGRKACVCASAPIQQFTQSVIWLALCALCHHIQSCPGSSCCTPEDDQVDCYTPTMRKTELMLTAALTTALLFIFIANPSWTCIQM